MLDANRSLDHITGALRVVQGMLILIQFLATDASMQGLYVQFDSFRRQ